SFNGTGCGGLNSRSPKLISKPAAHFPIRKSSAQISRASPPSFLRVSLSAQKSFSPSSALSPPEIFLPVNSENI
ncbi:hypothetical protein G4B88_031326, partial [Cannabis sativa]